MPGNYWTTSQIKPPPAADGYIKITNANREAGGAVKNNNDQLKQQSETLKEVAIQSGETFDSIRPWGEFFPILTSNIGELTNVWKDHIQVQQDAQVQAFERHKQAQAFLDDLGFEVQLLNAEVAGRKDLIPILIAERQLKGILKRDLNSTERVQLKERFDAQKELNRQLQKQNELSKAFGDISGRAINGYVRNVQEGMDIMQSFRNVIVAALLDIQAEFIKITLVNPFKNALTIGFNKLLDIGGFPDIALSSGSISNPLSDNPNIAALTRRAHGGDARRGQPIVVGDGGEDEIFFPPQNGTIIPRSAFNSQPSGDGLTIIQNINLHPNSDRGLQNELVAMLPALKQEIAEFTAEQVPRRTKIGRKFRS